MPLSTQFTISAAAQLTGSKVLEKLASTLSQSWSLAHADGTGAGQAAILWSDTRTLASSASENLDLNGGLVDALGNAVAITKLKGLIIANRGTTDLTIGNVANGIVGPFGAATHSLGVQAGGLLVLLSPSANGYPVVAGTADLLKVANAAGAVSTYDIVMIGA